MEETGWKKDQNPYLIFTCSKCRHYMYVRVIQKTKKCLRCGRQHKVSSIINSGEIVKGMTKAVETVKTRQNELAIKELGNIPEFRASDDFNVESRPKKIFDIDIIKDDNDFSSKFKKMLQEISNSFTQVPFYVFEIMIENFGIPSSEIKILVKAFQKEGILVHQDGFYKIQF